MLTDGKENKGEENKAPTSRLKVRFGGKNADGTPAADTANTERDNKPGKARRLISECSLMLNLRME